MASEFAQQGNKMTLFCVGDTDQTLYRFQGAKPELLTNDIDKWLPNIETVKLEINYRSTDEIIAKSQQLIAHNYSDLGGPYPQEFMKDAKGIKGPGEAVTFQMYSNAEHEALEAANTINELLRTGCKNCDGLGYRWPTEHDEVKEGEEDREIDCESCNGLGYFQNYNPGDVFIGARTRAQLGYLEGALMKTNIPFINITGGSFWQSKHVADVVSMIRMAQGDKDAFKRVNNIPSNDMVYSWNDKAGKFSKGDYCPARFLGAKFLAAINYDIEKIDSVYRAGRKGWQSQPRYGNEKKLTDGQYDLLSFLFKIGIQDFDNVGQIIRVIVDNCYEKYLQSQGVGDDGLSNAKLEDLATVEEIASRHATVGKFLAYVDEMIEAAEKVKNKDWGDYVVISTIHRLKGLERKVVFGLGWCEGVCKASGRDVGLLPHTFSLSSPPNFGVLPGGSMSPIQDERCIGFVLVSRAIERCYLSGIENYRSYQMGPSRFIHEMGLNNETN